MMERSVIKQSLIIMILLFYKQNILLFAVENNIAVQYKKYIFMLTAWYFRGFVVL